jgi:hypothetical protein
MLAELTLPFSRQPVCLITSGSKSSISPRPSVKDRIGASAQTGIALRQSAEFCALTPIEKRSIQHRKLTSVRIDYGANFIQIINTITPWSKF